MENVDFVSSFFAQNRYSAKKMAKPINFVCNAPDARRVYLLGNFNGWNSNSHPMQRMPDGAWVLEVPLHHGHHQYRFLVDGKVELDPKASGVARDQNGERASLLAVS